MTHLSGNPSTASMDNDALYRSRNFYEGRGGKKMVGVAILTQLLRSNPWLQEMDQ
jgi:hypothetical protein